MPTSKEKEDKLSNYITIPDENQNSAEQQVEKTEEPREMAEERDDIWFIFGQLARISFPVVTS